MKRIKMNLLETLKINQLYMIYYYKELKKNYYLMIVKQLQFKKQLIIESLLH